MLKRMVASLVALSWVLAAVLAAQQVGQRNATIPLPHTTSLLVTDWRANLPVSELREALRAFAEERGACIGQVVPSVQDHRGARTIYLTGPNSESRVQGQPNEDFGEEMRTTYALMTEIVNQSIVGRWIVYGDNEDEDALLEFLHTMGATASIEQLPTFPILVPQGKAPWVACLILAAATIGLVVSRTRHHAVARLHGRSAAAGWLRELAPLATHWLAAGVITSISLTAWVTYRFHGAGLTEALAQTIYLALLFLAAASTATVCALTVIYRVTLLEAVNGKLPTHGIIVISGVIRGLAVLLILAGLLQVTSLSAKTATRETWLNTLSQLGGAYHLTVGKAYSNEAQNAMGDTLRPWLRSHDVAGHLLLAKHERTPSGDLLIVNKQYLATHRISLIDGRDALDVVNDTQAILLTPQDRQHEHETLLSEANTALELETDQPPAVSTFTSVPDVSIPMFQATGVTGTARGDLMHPYLNNPTILVLPPGSLHSYATAASNGDLLVLDPDPLVTDINANPEFRRYVLSVTPIEIEAARAAAEATREFRLAIFTTITSACIAVLAGAALVVTYGKLRAQRISIRHLHGRSWFGSYAPLWMLEMVLALATLSHIPRILAERHSQYAALRHLGDATIPKPALSWVDFAVPTGVGSIVFISFLITVTLAHRRLISRETTEA